MFSKKTVTSIKNKFVIYQHSTFTFTYYLIPYEIIAPKLKYSGLWSSVNHRKVEVVKTYGL